jgi:hypothetical protein
MDAEAASVVAKAGVAGDDPVAIDAAEAQWIRPMRASIFERDGGSVGRAEEDNTGPQHPSAQRFTANVLAGSDGVPTVARVDLAPVAAARCLRAHGFSSHSPRLHRSSTSCGERQRETQTIMYSFEARSSSLSTESR